MDELLQANGINGTTGEYGLPPMYSEQLADIIEGEPDAAFLRELRWRYGQEMTRHLGVVGDADPDRLDEAGWGVIFAHNADPAIREALDPLLRLREAQAGDRFRVFAGSDGFHVGKDSKTAFLRRHGAGPGPVDPAKVPYYLLLVGDPETIPFRFQTQLDVAHAVGRIDFGDGLETYRRYAGNVVAAEAVTVERNRRMAFFGVSNQDDRATALSAKHLIAPLVEHVSEKHPSWRVTAHLANAAHKNDLARLLGGSERPTLLFSASHGMEFPYGDPRQLPHQGAILCQDWPRMWHGQIPQDFYFAADDLDPSTDLSGTIAFFFACYGAGTPRLDEFAKQAFQDRRSVIAPRAFLAQLPTRMLSNPGGGALAVVGHVERAWGCSFVWPGAGSQTAVFENALGALLNGRTIGSAIETFNERYAELSTVLSDELEEIEFGKEADPYELAHLWTANNDARGYTVLGDPAVRLKIRASEHAY